METITIETIKQKAQEMLNNNIMLNKPFSYHNKWSKELEEFTNKYWEIHGKNICKRNMINTIIESGTFFKDTCITYPNMAYLLESYLLENERWINVIKEL